MEYVTSPYAKAIIAYAKTNDNALVLSGDLTASTEISDFKKELPEKFVSMGMAEQNMLSWAGGMAREGFVPFLHTFSVFLYRRPYDQLSMSVAYPNLKVRLVGFLPGIMTPGGVTHQAIEDLAVLKSVPNMTIVEIGDATEIETILPELEKVAGPVYLRMLRGKVPRLFKKEEGFKLNTARILSEGEDATIFTSGICSEQAVMATDILRKRGVNLTHVHISTIKPFTDPLIVKALKAAKNGAISVENHTIIGGIGTSLAEVIAEKGLGTKLTKIGIPDTYAHGASSEYLMNHFGIDAIGIVRAVENHLGKSLNITEEDIMALQDIEVDEIPITRLEAL